MISYISSIGVYIIICIFGFIIFCSMFDDIDIGVRKVMGVILVIFSFFIVYLIMKYNILIYL